MWILHLIIIIAQKNCSLCFSLFIISPKGSNISCCVHVLLHTREEWQRQNGGDFLFPFEDDKPLRRTDDWVSCCTDNREGGWSPSPSLGGVLVPPQPRSSRYERVLVEPPQPSLQEPGRGLWPVILTSRHHWPGARSCHHEGQCKVHLYKKINLFLIIFNMESTVNYSCDKEHMILFHTDYMLRKVNTIKIQFWQ